MASRGSRRVPGRDGRRRSEFSLRAAKEAMPMRDAFAVLFFVSVGMLFDPASWSADIGRILAVGWRSSWWGKPWRHWACPAAGRRDGDGAGRRGLALPGRGVLVHPRHHGHGARTPPSGGKQSHSGRRPRLDHPQSTAFRGSRAVARPNDAPIRVARRISEAYARNEPDPVIAAGRGSRPRVFSTGSR